MYDRLDVISTLVEAYEARHHAIPPPDPVDAILFRIDSPGGSALAADHVWQAARQVQREGKPLIVSFSDVAASGGYYVAAGADAIVADPATLTTTPCVSTGTTHVRAFTPLFSKAISIKVAIFL